MASTRASAAITDSERFVSRSRIACSERASCASARPPISLIFESSRASSSSKRLKRCSFAMRGTSECLCGLADATRDVGLGTLIDGVGEDLPGIAELDQVAEVEERGLLRHARGL